jgi:hypothetical protein
VRVITPVSNCPVCRYGLIQSLDMGTFTGVSAGNVNGIPRQIHKISELRFDFNISDSRVGYGTFLGNEKFSVCHFTLF